VRGQGDPVGGQLKFDVRRAKLVLKSGEIFPGVVFGARRRLPAGSAPPALQVPASPTPAGGEVVFTTSMTGYTESLTDPSFAGQILVLTNPLIGNYGFERRRMESGKIQVVGLIVSELSPVFSNPQTRLSLDAALRSAGVPGLTGVDTRRLTELLRDGGSQNGVLAPIETPPARARALLAAVPDMAGMDLSPRVTLKRPRWHLPKKKSGLKIALVDYGVKQSIVNELLRRGVSVWRVPASTRAVDILSARLDGVLLSNGPGDPAAMRQPIGHIRALLGKTPMFGICLGHQLLGLAGGLKTFKLKFGHRGANHPVRASGNGRVAITTQNHGFSVRMPRPPSRGCRITHESLYDGTVEGLEFPGKAAFGVQFHPESSPGPRDSLDLFDRFLTMCKKR